MPSSLITTLLFRLCIFIALTAIFALPGALVLAALDAHERIHNLEQWSILAVVTGLAATIVIVSALSAVGIALSPANLASVFLGFLAILILCAYRRARRGELRGIHPSLQERRRFWIFLAFFLGLLVIKAAQIGDLFVPNWFDGLLHATLLERLSLQQAVPPDQIYHTGFQAAALFVQRSTGLAPADAVLLFGQWLSATGGMASYALARRFIRDAPFTYLAVIVYSLILLFPSFLVFWGRYPFLLGLCLLPSTILSSQAWVRRRGESLVLPLVSVLALFLAHYGAFLIWLAYMIVWIMARISFLRAVQRGKSRFPWLLLRPLLFLLPVLLAALPKLLHLASRPDLAANMLALKQGDTLLDFNLNILGMFLHHDYLFLLAWITAILIGSAWKIRRVGLLLLWPAMASMLIWLQYTVLGLSISTYANLLMFLSLPLAITFGLAAQVFFRVSEEGTQPVENLKAAKSRAAVARNWLLVMAAFLGMLVNIRMDHKNTVLFSPDDQLALGWIESSTSPKAVFMIRSVRWGGSMLPADGAGWIPLLTGRSVTYPHSLGEFYNICQYIKQKQVNYIYLQRGQEQDFDIHLQDLAGLYDVAYENSSVRIVSVGCP